MLACLIKEMLLISLLCACHTQVVICFQPFSISSLDAEILRIARATSNVKSFTESSQNLIIRMVKHGTVISKVQAVLKKFFGRHQEDFIHICNSGNDLSNLLCAS